MCAAQQRGWLTMLPVNVPVLSKATTWTSAAALSLPKSSTCMPLALSLPAHAPFEHTITVGIAMGAAATMVPIIFRMISLLGTSWLRQYGIAPTRKRQVCMQRAKAQNCSKSCRQQSTHKVVTLYSPHVLMRPLHIPAQWKQQGYVQACKAQEVNQHGVSQRPTTQQGSIVIVIWVPQTCPSTQALRVLPPGKVIRWLI